jgi:hypothetical protein
MSVSLGPRSASGSRSFTAPSTDRDRSSAAVDVRPALSRRVTRSAGDCVTESSPGRKSPRLPSLGPRSSVRSKTGEIVRIKLSGGEVRNTSGAVAALSRSRRARRGRLSTLVPGARRPSIPSDRTDNVRGRVELGRKLLVVRVGLSPGSVSDRATWTMCARCALRSGARNECPRSGARKAFHWRVSNALIVRAGRDAGRGGPRSESVPKSSRARPSASPWWVWFFSILCVIPRFF